MIFEQEFFQKIKFTPKQMADFWLSAQDDLKIAKESSVSKVKFRFAYDALIKVGITVIAQYDYKVRSKTGHHFKILEMLARILKDVDINKIGNQMRQNRNASLYDGIDFISLKDATSYSDFVHGVFDKAKKLKDINVGKRK